MCLSPSNFYGAQQARLPKPPQIKSQSLLTFWVEFLQSGCPSWRSNNSVKAVKAIKQTQVVTWRDLSRYPVVGRTRLSLVSLDQVYYKRIHTSRTKHTHTFNFRYIIIQKYTHKNTCVLHTIHKFLSFVQPALFFLGLSSSSRVPDRSLVKPFQTTTVWFLQSIYPSSCLTNTVGAIWASQELCNYTYAGSLTATAYTAYKGVDTNALYEQLQCSGLVVWYDMVY